MKACRECGTNNYDKHNYCTKCGSNEFCPEVVPCPHCKSDVEHEDRFCGNCGRSVV